MPAENVPVQLRTTENPPEVPEIVMPTPVVPAEIVAADYVLCDFCKCKLTPRGHVYEISDTAREQRDEKEKHAKQIAKLDEEISRLKSELSEANRKFSETQQQSGKRKFFQGGSEWK